MQRLFLTFFGFGLLPKAPGTWGSIAGAVVAYFVLYFLSSTTLFLASILLFLVSISVIDDFEKKVNSHDESFIVIDEVAGVWLAIAISGTTISQLILSLVLFRVLDIKKPSIIGRIDRNVKYRLKYLLYKFQASPSSFKTELKLTELLLLLLRFFCFSSRA